MQSATSISLRGTCAAAASPVSRSSPVIAVTSRRGACGMAPSIGIRSWSLGRDQRHRRRYRGRSRPRPPAPARRTRRRAQHRRSLHLRRGARDRPRGLSQVSVDASARGPASAAARCSAISTARRSSTRSSCRPDRCRTPASADSRSDAARLSHARLGLTIDSLVSAEVVTAGGEIVRASAETHADLFWALRGGGGNFGVVTEFEFELHPVGPLVSGGVFAFPFERAGQVLRASRALMDDAPDELSIHEILITVPSHEPFPPELRGPPAVFLVPVRIGGEGQAAADLAPLRRARPGVRSRRTDAVRRAPVDDRSRQSCGARSPLALALARRLRRRADRRLGRAVRTGLVAAVARHHGADRWRSRSRFRRRHRVRHRDAASLLWIIGYWPDPQADDAPHRAWVDDVFDAAAPFSTGGVYVNGLEDEGRERVRAAYGEETYVETARGRAPLGSGQRVPPQPQHPTGKLAHERNGGGTAAGACPCLRRSACASSQG